MSSRIIKKKGYNHICGAIFRNILTQVIFFYSHSFIQMLFSIPERFNVTGYFDRQARKAGDRPITLPVIS